MEIQPFGDFLRRQSSSLVLCCYLDALCFWVLDQLYCRSKTATCPSDDDVFHYQHMFEECVFPTTSDLLKIEERPRGMLSAPLFGNLHLLSASQKYPESSVG